MSGVATVPVAVVVLNFNGADVLGPCLASWEKSDPAPSRLLVVDNGSSDGSLEAGQAHYKHTDFLALECNLGFAAGNNRGIEKILSENPKIKAVFLCNNDTVVETDMLGLLWQVLEKKPRWAAVGPRIVFQKSGKIWYEGADIGAVLGRPSHWNWGKLAAVPAEAFKLPRWGFVTGCGLLMRREALEQMGTLDEKLWAYAEDSDWCFRAAKAGWFCGVVPRARMAHAVSASFSRMKARTAYLVTRNSLELIRRHRVGLFPGAWPLTLLLFFTLVVGWRFLNFCFAFDFSGASAMLKGTLDFIRGRWGDPVESGL